MQGSNPHLRRSIYHRENSFPGQYLLSGYWQKHFAAQAPKDFPTGLGRANVQLITAYLVWKFPAGICRFQLIFDYCQQEFLKVSTVLLSSKSGQLL